AAGAAAGSGAAAAPCSAGAALSALGCSAGAPASSVSSSSSSSPSLRRSPSLTFRLFTTPALGAGISMLALSDSRVSRLCSASMRSPTLTNSSMTSPSPLPMSGTRISSLMVRSSAIQRVGLVGVDAEAGDGLGHHLALDLAAVGQGLQRGQHDPVAVHLEEVAQLLAGIAAAEAVGAQHLVLLDRHPLADLLGEQLHVVGGGDHRALAAAQALFDVALPRLLLRVQAVVTLHRQAVAAQLVEAGDAPDVGADLVLLAQDLRRLAHLAQDAAATQQLHAAGGLLLVLLEQVHALDDAVLDAFRQRRLGVGLVHHREVKEDVLLQLHHLVDAFADDHRQLVAVGGVVAAAVGDGAGQDMAVTVLVLQAFTVQRGTPGGTADQKAAGTAVAGGPGQVADALEAEHRVEDVERQHRLVVGAVGGGRGNPAGHGAGLVMPSSRICPFLSSR